MKKSSLHPFQIHVWVVSMVLAPLLLTISQMYWSNGVLNQTAGWLQILAFTFWIPAFQAMFHLLRNQMPEYAVYGFLLSIYACIGGSNFGVDGIYGEALGIQDVWAKDDLHSKFGQAGLIAFYLPGVLFPISLVILGGYLVRTGTLSIWLGGLLMMATVGFPLSRIPRDPLLAHADNLLLLISHTLIALELWKKEHP